jgi:uncharacterized protein
MARAAGSALALAGVVVVAACGDGGGQPRADARPPDSFDRRAMIEDLAGGVILPTYQAFAARTGELGTAIDAWCVDGGALDAASRAPAQDAWRAAMDEWQRAELSILGPLAMDTRTLRDLVYSWPITAVCAVDQDVAMLHADPDGYDIGSRGINRRGLDALEAILFRTSLDHACPSQAAPAGWNELDAATRAAARCAFGQVARADLARHAATLVTAWQPSGGDYLGQLVRAGESGSAFASPQEAANVISDAMFYLDSDTKDMKLAEPAGLSDKSSCGLGQPCPAELETPLADHGKQAILANLAGFRALMVGGRDGDDGLGFDDFLRGVDAAEVADRMMASLDAADAAVAAIPGGLNQAITAERDAVIAAHAAVKLVTDDLKTQFLTVLGLDIPDNVQTDND